MNCTERWAPVVGYEDSYEVSDHERVRSMPHTRRGRNNSVRTFPARILRGWVNGNGYRVVTLVVGCKKTTALVHRLVLTAFVGPCPEGMEALHGDGDRTHASLPNLRWGTPSENHLDSVRHGTHHEARKTHCPAGHPYDDQNTYRSKRGGRACRTCHNASDRRRYAARKDIA